MNLVVLYTAITLTGIGILAAIVIYYVSKQFAVVEDTPIAQLEQVLPNFQPGDRIGEKCEPDKVRIPAFIVIIAAFVTVVQLLMAAYTPALNEQLGLFIPLIVVNCIVLGRAEAFASRNTVWASILEGLGMGIGFTLALLIPSSYSACGRNQIISVHSLGNSPC